MTIDGKQAELGQGIYFPWGKQWRAGQIEAFNEPVKAVKVMRFEGADANKRGKTQWFAATVLRWSKPVQEK